MITDFEVLSQVGKGLNSIVFKVRRIQDDRIYAMKKVKMDGLPQK